MGPDFPLHYESRKNCWEVHYSLYHPESNWQEVWEWCFRTFGHPGTDPDTGVKSSWDYHGGWLRFYNEKYVTIYLMRWS